MGLPCSLKPFQKMIWGQAEKRETGIPASLWSYGEEHRKGSLLCLHQRRGLEASEILGAGVQAGKG